MPLAKAMVATRETRGVRNSIVKNVWMQLQPEGESGGDSCFYRFSSSPGVKSEMGLLGL